MAEVIRSEIDGKHRYRITRTDSGFLITARSRDEIGLWLVCEWLHRTPEAANSCLDAVMSFNALWLAVSAGMPTEALFQKAERLSAEHRALCEHLNDMPIIGQDVKALREQFEEETNGA